MPPIPEWLKQVTRLDPPTCPMAELKETNPLKDACLQSRLKEGMPTISLEEVALDPNYVVLPNGVSSQPWSSNSQASYYIDHRKCTAWNYQSKCILFDAYAPVAAHRTLPKGTIVQMLVDNARLVESKCSGFKNTDKCFEKRPDILSSARVLQTSEPQDIVVIDRGPYVPGRDFDLSKGAMYLLAGVIGIKEGEMPVIVYIRAVPRSSFDASAKMYF